MAEREKVDLVLIAGDLFHRQPLMRELKQVNELFSGLTRTKVALIAGNHDYMHPRSNYRGFSFAENVIFFDREQIKGVELPEYQAAKVVFAFVGTEREIDTTALLRDVLNSGRTLCLPRCGAAHSMALCHVTSLEKLKPGAYGILEPVEDCPLLTVEDIDFVATPCLSCDLRGDRLGQGGGYYDRFFDRYHGPAALLCREKLLSDQVPMEEHDKRFSLIVTEKDVYRV